LPRNHYNYTGFDLRCSLIIAYLVCVVDYY